MVHPEPSDSLEILKDKIQSKTGIKTHQQTLLFKGKKLNINYSLGSYGINRDYLTIHLIHDVKYSFSKF